MLRGALGLSVGKIWRLSLEDSRWKMPIAMALAQSPSEPFSKERDSPESLKNMSLRDQQINCS
jgi:hypothetical protein